MPEFKWDPPGLKRVLLNKPCCLRERWHLRGSFQRYKGTLEPTRSNVSFAGGLFCREGWDTDEEALAQTDRYAQWLNDVHTKQVDTGATGSETMAAAARNSATLIPASVVGRAAKPSPSKSTERPASILSKLLSAGARWVRPPEASPASPSIQRSLPVANGASLLDRVLLPPETELGHDEEMLAQTEGSWSDPDVACDSISSQPPRKPRSLLAKRSTLRSSAKARAPEGDGLDYMEYDCDDPLSISFPPNRKPHQPRMQLVRSIEADNSQRIQSARARRKIADPDGLRSSKRRRGRSASADAVAPPVDSGLEPGELTQEEWPTLTPPPPPTDPPPVPPPPHPHWRWRLPFGLTSVHNGEVPVRRGGRVPSDGVYGDRTEYMVKAVLDHNLPRGNNGNDYESARWKVRWNDTEESEGWCSFWDLNEGAVNEHWERYERARLKKLGLKFYPPAYTGVRACAAPEDTNRMFRVLVIGSGTASVTVALHMYFKNVVVVSVDPEPLFGPTYCMTAEEFLEKINTGGLDFPVHHFDLIVGSPPCTAFSIANNKKGAARDAQIAAGMTTVKAFFSIVEFFQPKSWFLENPVGGLAKQEFMKPYSGWKQEATWCHYGKLFRKRSNIWTPLGGGPLLRSCCKDDGCENEGDHPFTAQSGDSGNATGSGSAIATYMIPDGVTITMMLQLSDADFQLAQPRRDLNQMVDEYTTRRPRAGTKALERLRVQHGWVVSKSEAMAFNAAMCSCGQ